MEMNMNLKEQLNGIQHIGIPTNDIEATVRFYETLGFEAALRTVNEEADEKVAFMKLNTLVIEMLCGEWCSRIKLEAVQILLTMALHIF